MAGWQHAECPMPVLRKHPLVLAATVCHSHSATQACPNRRGLASLPSSGSPAGAWPWPAAVVPEWLCMDGGWEVPCCQGHMYILPSVVGRCFPFLVRQPRWRPDALSLWGRSRFDRCQAERALQGLTWSSWWHDWAFDSWGGLLSASAHVKVYVRSNRTNQAWANTVKGCPSERNGISCATHTRDAAL